MLVESKDEEDSIFETNEEQDQEIARLIKEIEKVRAKVLGITVEELRTQKKKERSSQGAESTTESRNIEERFQGD